MRQERKRQLDARPGPAPAPALVDAESGSDDEGPTQGRPGARSAAAMHVAYNTSLVAAMRDAADERRVAAMRAAPRPFQLPPDLLALQNAVPEVPTCTVRAEPPVRLAHGALGGSIVDDATPTQQRTEVALPDLGNALPPDLLARVCSVPSVPAGFNACFRLRSIADPETDASPSPATNARMHEDH